MLKFGVTPYVFNSNYYTSFISAILESDGLQEFLCCILYFSLWAPFHIDFSETSESYPSKNQFLTLISMQNWIPIPPTAFPFPSLRSMEKSRTNYKLALKADIHETVADQPSTTYRTTRYGWLPEVGRAWKNMDTESMFQQERSKYTSKRPLALRRAGSSNIYLTSALNIPGWQ